MHSSPSSPASERATAYLHPGQLLVSAHACAVTTILGSCVAVCLWDPVAKIGGINHFMLPTFSGRSPRLGSATSLSKNYSTSWPNWAAKNITCWLRCSAAPVCSKPFANANIISARKTSRLPRSY